MIDLQITRIMSIPDGDIPQNLSKSSTVVELSTVDLNTTVDLVAIVYVLGPVQTYYGQDGSLQQRRTVTLVDDTLKVINLTLWGKYADDFDNTLNTCVELPQVKILLYQRF